MTEIHLTSPGGYSTGAWRVDPSRSTVAFSLGLMGARVTGAVALSEATLRTAARFEDSSVSAAVDLASLDTRNPQRDRHLRSPAFLNVETHRYAYYRATKVRTTEVGWLVDGELSLHGVTRPVPLTVTLMRFGADSEETIDIGAYASLDRAEFGVAGGRPFIGKKVSISLEIRAVR